MAAACKASGQAAVQQCLDSGQDDINPQCLSLCCIINSPDHIISSFCGYTIETYDLQNMVLSFISMTSHPLVSSFGTN